MCACPYVAGVKFTSSDFFQLERMKRAHPDLTIWNGYDEMLLSGLSAGADGGIGSTYNVLCPTIPARFTTPIARAIAPPPSRRSTWPTI